MNITNPDAARRALAWAKANPDKIVSGVLATNADGQRVTTRDPDATCFCLVGRIAHEADADVVTTQEGMKTFLDDINDVEANKLWANNDDGVWAGDPLRGFMLLETYLAQSA